MSDSNKKFTKPLIEKELIEFPERFSPNVLLRPLYQEVILPNIAYVGGGGEISYWLQLKAFFENQNDVGGNISTNNLKILINDSEVAQLFSDDFNVPAKKEFSIPLLANIPTKNLLNSDKNGLLGGLINSLLSKKVTVRIQGDLVYSFLGFQKDFLVDKTQEINIKF